MVSTRKLAGFGLMHANVRESGPGPNLGLCVRKHALEPRFGLCVRKHTHSPAAAYARESGGTTSSSAWLLRLILSLCMLKLGL